MVRVYIRDGTLYEFKDAKTASLWLSRNEELYDYDRANVYIYSDRRFHDIPVIEKVLEEYSCYIQCEACHTALHFKRTEEEFKFRVSCPSCGHHTIAEVPE